MFDAFMPVFCPTILICMWLLPEALWTEMYFHSFILRVNPVIPEHTPPACSVLQNMTLNLILLEFFDVLGLGRTSGRLQPCCTENTVRRVQYRYYPEALESVTDGRDFQNAVCANVCRLVENCTVLYKRY